jgi:hypothetical protein
VSLLALAVVRLERLLHDANLSTPGASTSSPPSGRPEVYWVTAVEK